MAMSNLQAQLASLNAEGGKNPGSSFATSKRHEDAVGRGLGHSVQHGHGVSTRDSKFKPSVLYADARAASDVPLTILRENAVDSLEQLVEQTQNESFLHYKEPLFGIHSLQLERGLSSKAENEQRHQTIGELLMLLGTTMAESMAAPSCLHVIEYLLRRFDIHLTCIDSLLISMLAHHEQPVFSRILQLVDLANQPTWYFLRPFAAPNAPPVSRRIIAKRASKAHVLMKHACDIAKHAARAHISEDRHEIRRGISHCLSFGAAVVVEGLTMQATATGTIEEASLRVVLPYCLNACGKDKIGSKNQDWRGFGYIVTSCIAEHAVLAPEAADALASTIVDGVSIYDEGFDVERVADGLATLMVVLSSLPKAENDSTLSVIGQKAAQYVGFTMPPKTFKSLSKLPLLVSALGVLQGHRGVVVANMIASLVVLGLQNAITKLVLTLIQDSALTSVWKDPQYNLVASFTYHLIQRTVKIDNYDAVADNAILVLEALRVVDSSACDAGIAHAVTSKKHSKATKARLTALLGIHDDNASSDNIALLPPRLALEHADASVRLAAIPRLTAEDGVEVALLRHFTFEDHMEIVLAAGRALQSMADIVPTSSAPSVLAALQRWALYDGVAEKPGKANGRTKTHEEFTSDRYEILEIAILLASHAAKGLVDSGADNETLAFLIQGIVAHLDFSADGLSENSTPSEKIIASKAATALSSAFFQKTKGNPHKNPRDLLFTDERVKFAVLQCQPNVSANAASLSRRCKFVFAEYVAEKLQSKATKNKSMIAQAGLLCCMSVLRSEQEIRKREGARLLNCIQRNVEHLILPELFGAAISLLSVSSEKAFSRVAAESIASICAVVRKTASPVTLLLEIATRENCPVNVLKRVLDRVADLVADSSKEAELAVVPTLGLLAHTDQDVRKTATLLLDSLNPLLDNKDAKVFASVGNAVSSASTSIQLNGASALPAFFRQAVHDADCPSKSRAFLLESCVHLLTNKTLISLGSLSGALRSCSMVLSAVEFSGESSFPLTERWSIAGSKIAELFLKDSTNDSYAEGPVDALLQTLGRMLKGGTVVDSASLDMDIIISTGPSSRGTRARSYSVGRSKGVALLSPYPVEMLDILVTCFNKGSATNATPLILSMCRTFLHDVVGRQSWSDGIFKKLSAPNRIQLAFAVITLRASGRVELDAAPFLDLPLDVPDVCSLIEKAVGDSMNLVALTFTMDYVRTNATRLSQQKTTARLIARLFETVGALSAMVSIDSDDDVEFAVHSMLLAIAQMLKAEKSHGSSLPKNLVPLFTSQLVELLGCVDKGAKDVNISLKSWKAKSTALELIACLCRCHPKTVVKMLIRALMTSAISNHLITKSDPPTDLFLRASRDTFIAMVPVIVEYAGEAGLCIFDLIGAFLAQLKSVENVNTKNHLFKSMAEALLQPPRTKECHFGTFLTCLLANEIASAKAHSSLAHFRPLLLSLLQEAPVRIQVESLKEFVATANSAVSTFQGQDVDADRRALLASIQTFLSSNKSSNMESTLSLANHLSKLVLDTLSFPLLEQFVRRGSDADSSLSLEIWQDLLLLQSSTVGLERVTAMVNADVMNDANIDIARHWSATLRTAIDDSLAALQNMLPAHIFLASASCLIEDGSNTELQAKALRFVAERASIVEPDSPEACLFLDIVPSLVCLFDSFIDTRTESFVVQQAIVMVIEQMARSLVLSDAESRNSGIFASALKSISRQLDYFATKETFLETDAVRQLICTMALGVATLVKVQKARCLPVLPKLISSFLTFLSYANHTVASTSAENLEQAKLMQLSSIRSLSAMAEYVPQFLIPYLDRLLSPAILASPSLKRSVQDDIVLAAMVEKLDLTLAKAVPCRQLLPSACKALSKCEHVDEYKKILAIMTISIEQAPKGDLPSVRNYVVKAILLSFDFDGSIEECSMLLDTANRVALALVMKLSEIQLRALFSKIREWRDEVVEDSSIAARRQHAFWSMTAVLSKELRSIFFSCMSNVVVDAVKELEAAVSVLSPKAVKLSGGKKKKKLEMSIQESTVSLRYLQPLLLCLEHTLKADAHEGGQWVRTDERYDSLLRPLTKLLQSDIPLDFPVPAGKFTSFQQLVMFSDAGNVISCITALASAAGNEQLWKPLNHGVLEACSNEHRSDVRKAGVSCLLSLIKALGEEYMVLLPECLPVLSELLEDSDEETAGLAQECVTLSEELLGESLQDSLR